MTRHSLPVKRSFTLIMGLIAALRGVAYIWPEGVPAGLQTLSLVPGGLVTWGWVWLTIGVLAIGGVFTSHTKAPLIPFVTVNLLWGGSYFAEWFPRLEWQPPGTWWQVWDWSVASSSRDWITCLSYFGLAVAALAVIRLVDPGEVKARVEGRRD